MAIPTRFTTAGLLLALAACNTSGDSTADFDPASPASPSAPAMRLTESESASPATATPAAPAGESAPRSAVARLLPASGSPVGGTVSFTEAGTFVMVKVSLEGLTPGEHGIHIHAVGDCSSADASSAGDHFSARPEQHGGPHDVARHTGDLGNVVAGQDGRVETSFVDERIALAGPESIIERAVVVHAGKDDFTTQPAGNAGARVACGVIEARQP